MPYLTHYQTALHSPKEFWQNQSKKIPWFKPPTQTLTPRANGLYDWYADGELNTCYLALDHHVANGRGKQVALIYDSPVTQTKEQYTYRQLLAETAHFAGVLQDLGVAKGDRVIIYMPMIPQTVFAMLACARLGAVHSVVFGGFAAHELAIRIDDAQPKVVLLASGGKEIDRIVPYKPIIDAALAEATHQPDACVVYQRNFVTAAMEKGRDYDWDALLAQAQHATYVIVKATDPLYILYTSGTTGQPKGIVRDNGGHAVALRYSMEAIYGVQPGDVYWAASDVGWVVGHSYIVYAPLLLGCTTILFEGKPIKTPDASTFWRVMAEYQVKVFFTAPTAFRAIRKEDPQAELSQQYDLSHLKQIFLAGERTDASTYDWLHDLLQIPVIDHWWQTESGWPMIANPTGIELLPTKVGSAGVPVCGFDIQILDPDGQPLGADEEGAVAIKYPLPPGCLPTLYQNDERFKEAYLSQFDGYYFSGDGGYKDADGYVYITGRIDDIINVAGHRLSTAEMEEVVAAHGSIAECCVIGVADEMKGQIPVGFYVTKSDVTQTDAEIEVELIQMVRHRIGPVAAFKRAVKVDKLPKTRSGKILRKVMRAIADRRVFSAPSTIEDLAVLVELERVMEREGIGGFNT